MNLPVLVLDAGSELFLSVAESLVMASGLSFVLQEYATVFEIQPGGNRLIDEQGNVLTDENGDTLTW